MYNTDSFTPARFEAQGQVSLGAHVLPYRCVSEDNLFYNETGKAIASIFTYSYFNTAEEEPEKRPVLFCFGGGPGGSSQTDHVNYCAPWRIRYPDDPDNYTAKGPFELIPNEDTLLFDADVVLVDPVGTGYSLILDSDYASDFLGIEEDAEMLVNLICRWLTKYHRWNSPKYLLGGSYGCARIATMASIALAGGKTRSYNLAFHGLIACGNTIATAKYFNREKNVYPAVEALPTYAATHWYHNRPVAQSLEDFVSQAQKFAESEYLTALYKGEWLTEEEKDRILDRLTYFTGLSRDFLLAHDLKPDRRAFQAELLREKGMTVAIIDSRFKRRRNEPSCLEGTVGNVTDAAQERYRAYVRSGLDQIFQKIGITDFGRSYVPYCSYGTELVPGADWNFEVDHLTSGQRLSIAMQDNPNMRMFFANGWYDLCTQTGIVWHSMRHLHLPEERTYFKGYPTGHILTLGDENLHAFTRDLQTFLRGEPL